MGIASITLWGPNRGRVQLNYTTG